MDLERPAIVVIGGYSQNVAIDSDSIDGADARERLMGSIDQNRCEHPIEEYRLYERFFHPSRKGGDGAASDLRRRRVILQDNCR